MLVSRPRVRRQKNRRSHMDSLTIDKNQYSPSPNRPLAQSTHPRVALLQRASRRMEEVAPGAAVHTSIITCHDIHDVRSLLFHPISSCYGWLYYLGNAINSLTISGQNCCVAQLGGGFAGFGKGYAMISGGRYSCYRVYWHSPSENTVDGIPGVKGTHPDSGPASDLNTKLTRELYKAAITISLGR